MVNNTEAGLPHAGTLPCSLHVSRALLIMFKVAVLRVQRGFMRCLIKGHVTGRMKASQRSGPFSGSSGYPQHVSLTIWTFHCTGYK